LKRNHAVLEGAVTAQRKRRRRRRQWRLGVKRQDGGFGWDGHFERTWRELKSTFGFFFSSKETLVTSQKRLNNDIIKSIILVLMCGE